MLPLLEFQPILKRARWGGRRLGTRLHKPLGPHADYAESWELADRPRDQSIVMGGVFNGWTLNQLVRERAADLLGQHSAHARFPLLVKFLDTADRLSVQVHPNDRQADAHQPGESGKTEAWVILHAEPDSHVYVGLKHGVTRADLERALSADSVEECLHEYPVRAGDCVHVPAGTVHALGAGLVLAEIQQSSELTFRLYDWGRLGSDGKPRPLHIPQALDCIDFTCGPVDAAVPVEIAVQSGRRIEELVRNPYFVLRRHTSTQPFAFPPSDSFRVLMVVQGKTRLICAEEERFAPLGTTLLLPASAAETRVEPAEPAAEITLLECFLP